MTEDQEECDVTYKILLLGDSGVGKTSLIQTLTGNKFSHSMLTTVGIDFVKVPFNVDGAKVRLQIWDTAGQERFRSITKFQYRSTKGLLLLYDITNRKSYETLSYWLNTIEKDIDQSNREPIPIIIVGNKCDLENERVVSTYEGEMVADSNYLAGFFETSACTGTNVQECFQRLAHSVTEVFDPHLMKLYDQSTTPPKSGHMTITRSPVTPPSSSACPRGKRQSTIKLTKSLKRSQRCGCKNA